jgi:hypothetical protein
VLPSNVEAVEERQCQGRFLKYFIQRIHVRS